MDLLLAGGFLATGVGTFAFAVAPVLSGDEVGLGSVETWAAIGASLFGAALIAFAPFVTRRTGQAQARARRRPSSSSLISLVGIWLDARFLGLDLDAVRAGRRSARRRSSAPTACSPSSRSSRSSASGCASAGTAAISTAG